MTQRALICGVSGQDGAYLAASLLKNGYECFGDSLGAPADETTPFRLRQPLLAPVGK
jgi:GDP-D-mannose dehydratase